MLAGAFKGCSTVICRGWNPVPNSWWLQQGEISTVTLMRAQICMAHRANQRASSLLMCWGSNNLLPLLLRLEDFQSLYKGQCNWRRGGGTDRHRWGGGKEEDLGNLLQLSVNFCRVYIRLKSEDRCWGWCFATALHVGNQASFYSPPPPHPPPSIPLMPQPQAAVFQTSSMCGFNMSPKWILPTYGHRGKLVF